MTTVVRLGAELSKKAPKKAFEQAYQYASL